MAAPEKFFDYDFLDDGLGQDIQWVAPVIGGITAAPTLNQGDQGINGGWSFEWPATTNASYGVRKVLPATRDISSRRFVWCSGFSNQFATPVKFADLADGGLRFYLTDSAGNYRGYTLYGRDIGGATETNPRYAFTSFLSMNTFVDQMWWCIDLDRNADYSSGTLDLTDIVAIEVHVYNAPSISQTSAGRFACGYICAADEPIIRAGDISTPADFSILVGNLAIWNTGNNPFYPGGARQSQNLTLTFDGANGQVYNTVSPVHIGDGTTGTYFRQGRGQLAVQMSIDTVAYRIAQGETPAVLGPYLPANTGRTHTINQSSTDNVEISDFIWSGYENPSRVYAVEVTGSTSGSCSFIRNSFFRADFIRLRHATATDCVFDACDAVEITSDTVMTGATIRNAQAGTSAFVITSGAGDYSNIDVLLNNPSATADIALGSGGAGTYDLTGVRVNSGYTLKIRNDSATNAVTVIIPSGITTSTSTVGGTITIQQPATTYTLQFPNIVNGSRFQIYNVTTATELTNTTVSGGLGINVQYTKGTDYSSGDSGRYRITYQNGTNAMESIEGVFTFTNDTAINSIPITQEAQAVYETFGVDGSTVTEFSWDSGNIQVDINDADNTTNIQRLGSWYYYFITTATGIDEAFDAISWESINSIKINTANVDMTLDNVKATPLLLIGGRIYRDDGATIIASTSNSIQVDYEPVYSIVTSGGGSSGDDAATIYAYFTSSNRQNVFKADVSGLAIQTSVDVISANVNSILTDTGTTIPAQITGLNDISVSDIEQSSILAKESTCEEIKKNTNLIPATV